MNTKIGSNKKEWLIPAGLLVLSAIPILAGAARLTELSVGAEITPANARFFAAPLPVVLHILSVTLYSLLGAFQFARGFRLRRHKFHRISGWALAPTGLIAALSGLWMTLFYPWPEGDGVFLYWQRLVFGSAMLVSILMAVVAIRQRDYIRHGAWMLRAYAIGLGAGTQVLTHLPWFILFGTPGEFPRALLMGAGWVINLIVAEWVISKHMNSKKGKRIRNLIVT